MRVAVLPTGGLELRGLPSALRTLFPGHDFYAMPKRAGDSEPFDSFTSSGKPLARGAPNGNVAKIVQAMVAELVPGRRGEPPDLLIVIEDLELPNKQTPDVVIDIFRDATLAHLQALDQRLGDRARDALVRKASFHLAVPMIEAWLFADPQGPENAGVPIGRLPAQWRGSGDAEDFLTTDPGFLADDCAGCATWNALPPPKQKQHKPAWRTEQREQHPKAFLAWLCRDAAEKKCSRYRETHEGAGALMRLDWWRALAHPQQCTFLRALVMDLAAGLGQAPASPVGGATSQLTSHTSKRSTQTLRNL